MIKNGTLKRVISKLNNGYQSYDLRGLKKIGEHVVSVQQEILNKVLYDWFWKHSNITW